MIDTFLPTEKAMLDFGARLANACGKSAVIFLYGNLGAGKTTLARGFLRGLGYEGNVKSPTYTIVESYSLQSITVYHFDLYRVRDVQELEFIGIKDYFNENSICLIEWPEHGAEMLPPADLACYIEAHHEGRKIKLEAYSAEGKNIVNQLEK